MRKHLRASVAAFSVLGLALVGCETDNGDDPGEPGIEEPADDTLEDDTGLEDDTLEEETTDS